ncbi:hypothetical protein BDA96_02G256100 [Sorghum bicolor]|uniref:Uncharacterized protein n=2 Tax=Sorghum bicolor TaxID=4558 RepID=A0A921UU26_SORBI|nr:hypothetical protein BDA96_02G256100 [Sorghum bicolor]KXG35894.1 hypothetical protein SORBI_3002G244800 [Sorghum bicolor]
MVQEKLLIITFQSSNGVSIIGQVQGEQRWRATAAENDRGGKMTARFLRLSERESPRPTSNMPSRTA